VSSVFFCGLDLGQSQDFSALTVIERILMPEGKPHYHVRHLQRFPLQTSYPDIVHQLQTLLTTPLLLHHTLLAVDATGVGAPVVDLLTAARLPCLVYSVHIHGGDVTAHE